MEYVLWGKPAGDTDALYEKVLSCRENRKEVEAIQKIAAKDGWHSFRIVPLGTPNFGKSSLAA